MKPAVHKRLTEVAIALCGERLSSEMRSFASEIAKGSVYEDNVSLERLFNWHFYRSADSTIPRRFYGFMRPTSEHILLKHIQKMLRHGKKERERYEQLGRVLHHIQDMSTPSHVLAIYHDPATIDQFEAFVEVHLDTIAGDGTIVPINSESDGGLAGIYHRYVTHGTFEATEHGTPKQLPLTRFWHDFHEDEDPRRRGFGMFGDLHECFNPVGGTERCPYEITLHTLLKIQEHFCRRAIADSCLALLYADAHASPPA